MVGGVERISEIRYFDGHYDGRDHIFCGFGSAEMTTRGDDSIQDLLVRHHFHHGNTEGITGEQEKAKARALRHLPFRREYFGLENTELAKKPFKIEDASWEAYNSTGRGRRPLCCNTPYCFTRCISS